MKRVRCAIYTRKSSEEGLEQSFNSLDAQREACAAYILSQASEGWSEIKEQYDDGGLSGGTLERPALQRLLTDVRERRIDIIVVYKVDRLTRSLLDFARLVEAFDAAGVSFVSVTQSFNTTTSMGRLTLNMLLSFAQFEREVTAERIRDKIAASKARGMWMGGTPPLGYAPDGRTLKIVDEHAALVRHIFSRYLALGSVWELKGELAAQRVIMPVRTSASGKSTGGGAFARGHLYFILRNPVYAGLIRHKEVDYPGQHLPIISSDLWQQVQARLADNTQGTRNGTRATHASLLAGLVIDEGGQALIATHASKANGSAKVRYRYYVAPATRDRGEAGPALRVPARELESAVIAMLQEALSDPLELAARASLTLDAARISDLFCTAEDLAFRIRRHERVLVRELVSSVQLTAAQLRVTVSIQALARLLRLPCPADPAPLILTETMRLTRTGRAMRLIQTDGRRAAPEANASMVKLIARARIWWARLRTGQVRVCDLAAEEGCTKSYVTRVVRLAFVSPALVEQIVAGTQPAALSSALLKKPDQPAISWVQQRRELGGSAAD
jgi:site-specific DNA recombinase